MSLLIDYTNIQTELGIRAKVSSTYPASPGLRNYSVTIPNMPGAHDMGADLEPFGMDLRCNVLEESHIDLQFTARELKAMLFDQYGKPKTVKLAFQFEKEKFYWIRVQSSISLERLVPMGKFTIPVIAYDPFLYARDYAEDIVWGSETIDFQDNYLLGHEGATPQTNVTGSTTLDYYVDGLALKPYITISGSANNLTITNNGQVLTFPNFTNAEWVLDCEEYEVYKNGALDYDSIKLRDFWLYEGNNSVAIDGDNINITISMKYRDRYL